MSLRRSFSSAILMLALFGSALFFCGQSSAQASTRKGHVFTTPLQFIENQGQVQPQVKFYAKGSGQHIFFTRGNISFSLNKTKGGFNSDVARRAAPLTALWRKLIRSVEAPQIRI
jgi:hypothetical protein